MRQFTILFTDMRLETAGIVVVSGEEEQPLGIDRHAHEQGKYIHAFLLQENGFQPLHYDEEGMEVQEAIDRIG